jgi:hypothetical protein
MFYGKKKNSAIESATVNFLSFSPYFLFWLAGMNCAWYIYSKESSFFISAKIFLLV